MPAQSDDSYHRIAFRRLTDGAEAEGTVGWRVGEETRVVFTVWGGPSFAATKPDLSAALHAACEGIVRQGFMPSTTGLPEDLRTLHVPASPTPRFEPLLWLAAAIILLAILWPALARAENPLPGVFKGAGGTSICTGDREACSDLLSRPMVDGEVHWQVGILVGEPVVDMRVAWKPNALAKHVAPIYGKVDPLLGLSPESEAAQQLRLYNVTTRLTVTHGNATYTLDQDPGVPDAPGSKLSYNTPGIPDWGRFLRNANGEFVAPEQAKEIFRSGAMATAQASIVSAAVDTSRFEQWWLDKNVERYAAPLRAAIDARLAALGEAFGLPTDGIRAEIAALKGSGRGQILIGKLEDILQKLSPDRIPAKFLGEGPERLARLKRYADAIAPTEAGLRDATKTLPPMPGTSERYDTWHEQVQTRLSLDAARLARLQERQDEADRLEREAAAAELRAAERAKASAEKQRRRREAELRRKNQELRRRVASYQSSAPHSWGGSVTDSFQSSGWGHDSYRFNPSYWTADGYITDPESKSTLHLTANPRRWYWVDPKGNVTIEEQ